MAEPLAKRERLRQLGRQQEALAAKLALLEVEDNPHEPASRPSRQEALQRQQAAVHKLASSAGYRRRPVKPLPAEPSPRAEKVELRSGGVDMRGDRHFHYRQEMAGGENVSSVDSLGNEGGLAAQMQRINLGLPAHSPTFWIDHHRQQQQQQCAMESEASNGQDMHMLLSAASEYHEMVHWSGGTSIPAGQSLGEGYRLEQQAQQMSKVPTARVVESESFIRLTTLKTKQRRQEPEPARDRQMTTRQQPAPALAPVLSSAAAADSENAPVVLRNLWVSFWKPFNTALSMPGLRVPPRLRLPPAGWSAEAAHSLEQDVLRAGGLPPRVVGALPLRHSGSVAAVESCSICLDGFAAHRNSSTRSAEMRGNTKRASNRPSDRQSRWLRELPCGHYFHHSCICGWLLTHRACPLCRTEVRPM